MTAGQHSGTTRWEAEWPRQSCSPAGRSSTGPRSSPRAPACSSPVAGRRRRHGLDPGGRTSSSSTGPSSSEPRRARRLGQQQGDGARRDHQGHPRPGGRQDRAGHRRRAGRHAPGGRHEPGAPSPPADTDEDRYRGLLAAQDYLLSLGITGWQDAIVGSGFADADAASAYHQAASAGTLRADVVGALWWQRDEGLEQLPGLLHRRAHDGRDGFRLTSVKMMLDGVAENHTAAMLDPYLDGHGCATENSVSTSSIPPSCPVTDRPGPGGIPGALPRARRPRGAQRAERRRRGARRGPGRDHQASPRAPAGGAPRGHRAVRRARRDREHPAAVGHRGRADDRADDPVPRRDQRRPGSTRSAASSPAARTWRRAATGRSAARTRCSASTWRSTARRRTARTPRSCPDQAIPLATALAAYTSGTATVNGVDGEAGRIRPGYHASFAVTDADLAAIGDHEICAAAVTQTWVRGELAYQED